MGFEDGMTNSIPGLFNEMLSPCRAKNNAYDYYFAAVATVDAEMELDF